MLPNHRHWASRDFLFHAHRVQCELCFYALFFSCSGWEQWLTQLLKLGDGDGGHCVYPYLELRSVHLLGHPLNLRPLDAQQRPCRPAQQLNSTK